MSIPRYVAYDILAEWTLTCRQIPGYGELVFTRLSTQNIIFRTPLDSTPSQFDTQFYIEVLLRGTGYPG